MEIERFAEGITKEWIEEIFPKMCQLFKKELQYIANTTFIKGMKVCMKPMRTRIEAIKKLNPPTTPE